MHGISLEENTFEKESSKNPKPKSESTPITRLFVGLFAMPLLIWVGIGTAAAAEEWVIMTVFIACGLPLFAVFLTRCNLEFGASGVTPKQLCFEAAFGVLCGIIFFMMPLIYDFPPKVQNPIMLLMILTFVPAVRTGARYGPQVAFGSCLGIGCVRWQWVSTALPFAAALAGVIPPTMFMSLGLVHGRDGNMVMFAAVALGNTSSLGAFTYVQNWLRLAVYVSSTMAVVYLFFLFCRRSYRLPPALEGIKWVRLSYLREMYKKGDRIKRCQDLPSRAFGDFSKAKYLIILSHRWIDRFACDSPDGLRLRTMLEKLNSHFSPGGCCTGRTICERWRRMWKSMVGGAEVLIFFDFMSLPQEALASDGTVIPRTPKELAVFMRCLPNMGSLYSMLPVLVCEEVPEGVAPYDTSGWCFSELNIANLGNQLSVYSPQHVQPFLETSGHLDKFEGSLQTKVFFKECDRHAVLNIGNDFLRKRRLMDAIKEKRASDINVICTELNGDRLQDLLDQPVDQVLNTCLHLAVAARFEDGVKILMHHGANPKLRNLHGDTPTQWFMWSRVGAAAKACRQSRPDRPSTTNTDADVVEAKVAEAKVMEP